MQVNLAHVFKLKYPACDCPSIRAIALRGHSSAVQLSAYCRVLAEV